MTDDPSILRDTPPGPVLYKATCCRDWPVLATAGIGRCGICGTRPIINGPWEDQ